MNLLFIWPNKDAFGIKPINISLLSALAKQSGWQTRLYDTTHIDFGYKHHTDSGVEAKVFKPVDMSKYGWQKGHFDLAQELLDELNAFNPDCVALTVLSDESAIAARITALVKAWKADVPVIWGGKFPTLEPEKTLLDYNADFACRGEGLEAFPEFLDALEHKKDLYSIRNIWAKRDTYIIKNPIRPLLKDLDSLPYLDWDIFTKKGHFYKPFNGQALVGGDHMTNWGCPYACTYCINHVLHELYDNKDRVRRYGVDRIVDEMSFLAKKYGLEFFRFYDEDFLMRPTSVLREFSEKYKERVDLPCVIETNPHTVTEEKAILLKNMNCVSASLAIETGDPELRKNLLRRIDSEKDIVNAFHLVNSQGIRTTCFIMLGLPFETRETYKKSIQLVKKAHVQSPCITFFFPFEKTVLRKVAIDNGFYSPHSEKIYQSDYPALSFPNLSGDQLVQMRKVFNLYVKLPDSLYKYIERSECLDKTGCALREKLMHIYDDYVWKNDGYFLSDDQFVFRVNELELIYNAYPGVC